MNKTILKPIALGTLTLLAVFWLAGPAAATSDDMQTGYLETFLGLGYRNVWPDKDISRAMEYASTHNSVTGELLINAGEEQKRFYLNGSYLNEQDYTGELELDYRGLVRVDLGTERMVHNLEHIPYRNRVAPPNNQSYPGQNGYLTYDEQNPRDKYQVELSESSVHTRIKHPDYPAHLNLNYWRFEREGHQQLRFVDEGNGNLNGNGTCTKCHMLSKTRAVDWTTDEFSAGVDAHVGPVDLIVEQLYREFHDQNPIPADLFGTHNYRDAANGPTVHEHDEAPDGKFSKTTLKLHSSLAGGLVGAAAFSLGTMENQSALSDVRPVSAETDFLQLAGDATYIINPQWTINVRYRMTDLDTTNTDFLTADGVLPANGPLPVRDNVDVTRGSYEASVSYRPSRAYTLRAEYRYLDIDRGNTSGPVDFTISGGVITQPDLSWELPDQETVQRIRLSFQGRPLGSRKLQLKSHYTYETANDSAYGTSYQDRHDLYGGVTWTAGNRWGVNGSARYTHEENNDHALFLSSGTGGFIPFNPTHTREVTNLVAGAWFAPFERLTVNANYGYLRTEIEQDLIFGGQPSENGPNDPANFAIFDDKVPFDQTVQTATVLFDWHILESLGCTLEGRLIQSKAYYEPDFPATTLTYGVSAANPTGYPVVSTSDGLRQISELDVLQSGWTIALDWQPYPAWSCSASYSFDEYNDKHNGLYEGSVEIVTASLGYSW